MSEEIRQLETNNFRINYDIGKLDINKDGAKIQELKDLKKRNEGEIERLQPLIAKNQQEIDKIDAQLGSGRKSDGLYDNQIEEIMKDYNNKGFKGVYAIDEINKIPVSDKMGFILNLDTSDQKGSHWVAIYIDAKDDNSVEYYDSFGNDPPERLMKGLKTMIK